MPTNTTCKGRSARAEQKHRHVTIATKQEEAQSRHSPFFLDGVCPENTVTWSLKGSVQFMSSRSSPSSFSREFPSNFFSYVKENKKEKKNLVRLNYFMTRDKSKNGEKLNARKKGKLLLKTLRNTLLLLACLIF